MVRPVSTAAEDQPMIATIIPMMAATQVTGEPMMMAHTSSVATVSSEPGRMGTMVPATLTKRTIPAMIVAVN